MKPLNIFDILSAGDKELVHSSMLKYFIDFEMFKRDFFSFIAFTEPEEKLYVKLEKTVNLEMANKPKKRLRFDLTLTPNDDGTKVEDYKLIIENKFKATPHLNQLIDYDQYIKSKELNGIQKILFVLSEEQIPINVKNYCHENNWKIRSYIFLDPLKKDPNSNLLDWIDKINLDKNFDARTKLLINDYRDYLKSLRTDIIQFTDNNYFIPYLDTQDRHTYAQYLMFIQSLIYKKFDEAGLKNIITSNDGGKNKIPSIAFWQSENLNAAKPIIAAYTGIDGDTFKLGVNYDKKNHAIVDEFVKQVGREFNPENKGYTTLGSKSNNRTVKAMDANKPNKTESVYSIFTFSIHENQPVDNVINDIADISMKYFEFLAK